MIWSPRSTGKQTFSDRNPKTSGWTAKPKPGKRSDENIKNPLAGKKKNKRSIPLACRRRDDLKHTEHVTPENYIALNLEPF